MLEIERKFLIKSDDFKKEANKHFKIAQGYLNSDSERTVRVRIKENKGFLTIKGISNESGLSRFDWEKEIDLKEAESLMLLCESGKIEKIRYEIPIGKHLYEVDVFEGENSGLIIAEIELKSESEPFEKPDWLGEEVTGDLKYYNSYLSQKPFKKW